MDLRKLWGRNIAGARQRKGMSQERLARTLDVSNQVVSRWERGVYAPRDQTRIRLAEILGVPVSALFPYPGEQANGDTEAA